MNIFTCDDCQRQYLSRNAFRQHRKTHGQDAPRCIPCNRAFVSPADLRRHLDSGIHADNRQFACPECPRQFTKRSHLTRHRRQQHEGRTTFEMRCSQCSSRLENQFRPLKVCKFHATELGLITEGPCAAGVSRGACRCFDLLESMFGLKLRHVHFHKGPDGREKLTGSEAEGLIPGLKIRPDAVSESNPRHVYEYLGNPWHGYPPSDGARLHRFGKSHTGVSNEQLYTTTMARLKLFHDHGFVVHYIWEHEFKAANKRDPREVLAVVHVLNPFEPLLDVL